MDSAGIKDLRQKAGELIRRAELGEIIEITDRGRPVALLGPLPNGSSVERLRTRGEIQPASRDLEDLPEPIVLDPGVELPSETLLRLRRHER